MNEQSNNGMEWCDRCGEPHNNCQDGKDGEDVCPPCIRKEAEKERAEQKEEEHRREVYRERGRWYAR